MASTLEKVAELSGVSRSTVSRVINHDARVSATTRARVWEVIEQLGYRPNLSARGLATGRSNVLSVVIPVGTDNVLADPFIPALLHGIAEAADGRDHFVMLALAEPGFKHRVDEVARQGIIGGVIYATGQLGDPLLERLLENGTPFVSVGRNPDERVSYVDYDNFENARQMTCHLLRLGRRRVATITGPQYSVAGMDRLGGYRQALEDHGVRVEEELISEGDFSEASGRDRMRQLLEHRPDAVFAASDRMAAGALNELRAAGIRVGEDIALTGFDDMPLAREMEPALTTMRQRPEQLGAAAVDMLLDLMRDPAATPRRLILPAELIVRDSCGSSLL